MDAEGNVTPLVQYSGNSSFPEDGRPIHAEVERKLNTKPRVYFYINPDGSSKS